MPTTPPDPWKERAELFEAIDEVEDLPPAARAILDTDRAGAEKARKVADYIAEVYG